MTGPVGAMPRNLNEELAKAIDDQSGWEWFKTQFLPAATADTFRPSDDVMVGLARYAATPQGRQVVEWLHALTDRAPYPLIDGSIEQVAIAAAKHQGRAGVGEVIRKAIAEGQRLIELQHRREP